MNWISTNQQLPPNGVIVETKIDDKDGVRNIQDLKLSDGRIWFLPDGKMYVYYRPTHWRYKTN